MRRAERISGLLLVALVASLPFEFRFFPILSNLQWLFAGVAVLSLPILVRDRNALLGDRLVLAAMLFVLTQWLAAFLADDVTVNAVKGAVRVTAGFTLLCVTLRLGDRPVLMRAWSVSAVLAALYGILDYGGWGAADLFREGEFYFSGGRRLSGSFEYPNTAAAFFALSIPVVWTTPRRRWVGLAGALLIWSVLLLTYSRGAAIAVALVVLGWAASRRSRSAVVAGGVGAAVFIAFLAWMPSLFDRFVEPQPVEALSAEYQPEFNLLRHRPDELDLFTLEVRNTGTATWFPDGDQPVSISFRWYDQERLERVLVNHPHTRVPRRVEPGESVTIRAVFRTPGEAGAYVLVWDMARRGDSWFSAVGDPPAVVDAHIDPENEIWYGAGSLRGRHRPENFVEFAGDIPVSRTDLWRAAAGIALEHPILGRGPDSFRLLHGERLGLARPNTEIRANNLYLELLAGSGLAGLAAFLLMMGTLGWSRTAPAIALGVFLIHGLVDTFLMTTPIYFAFWILLGVAGRSMNGNCATIQEKMRAG